MSKAYNLCRCFLFNVSMPMHKYLVCCFVETQKFNVPILFDTNIYIQSEVVNKIDNDKNNIKQKQSKPKPKKFNDMSS